MSDRTYYGSGLVYDKATGEWVYAENIYWDDEYGGWQPCHSLPRGAVLSSPRVPTAEEERAWCNGG